MNMTNNGQTDSKSFQVLQALTDRIKNGVYPPESLLPAENQLAKEFLVSRATIRRAFDKLAERDLVIKRQGDGTYVSKLSSIANPLNQFIDIRQRIKDHGLIPGFITLGAELIDATSQIASQLSIRPGSQVAEVKKIFTADEEPIIFVVNHIPIWVFQDKCTLDEISQPEFMEPFFEIFENKFKQKVKYYTSSIRPEIFRNLELPELITFKDPCTPILIVEDVGYNYDEVPVFCSLEHFTGNSIGIELVRRTDIY